MRARPAPRACPAGNSPRAGCPASRSGRRLRPRTRRTRSGRSRPAPSGTAQWRGSRDTLEDVVRLAVLAGDFACDGPLMTIRQINAPVGIVSTAIFRSMRETSTSRVSPVVHDCLTTRNASIAQLLSLAQYSDNQRVGRAPSPAPHLVVTKTVTVLSEPQ